MKIWNWVLSCLSNFVTTSVERSMIVSQLKNVQDIEEKAKESHKHYDEVFADMSVRDCSEEQWKEVIEQAKWSGENWLNNQERASAEMSRYLSYITGRAIVRVSVLLFIAAIAQLFLRGEC